MKKRRSYSYCVIYYCSVFGNCTFWKLGKREGIYTANTSFLILQRFVNSLTDRKARFHQLVKPIYCTTYIVDDQAVTFMEKILQDVWHIEGST